MGMAINSHQSVHFNSKISLLGRQPLGCVQKCSYKTVHNGVAYILKSRNDLNNILYIAIKQNIMKSFKIKIF